MPIKHTEISNLFTQFIESFSNVEKENFDLNSKEISEAIFVHIFKIKVALWKHEIRFKRKKRMAISDLFQEIIAMYLKLALNDNFEVILEEKVNGTQPDILIRYKGKNLFILEIKTTLGWNRDFITNKEIGINKRILTLSKTFNIPEDNIVFIFLSPGNVKKDFLEKYWDSKNNRSKSLPSEYPYNKVRPLLYGEDPYYWNYGKEFNQKENFKEFPENFIKKIAKERIVIPLELTIKEIIVAAEKI